IDGYITLAGPHDYFLPTDKDRWTRIFGEDKGRQVDALTVNHIHPDNPPTLILHGGDDDIVTPRSADSLAGKLTRAGVANTRKVYAGVTHIRIAAAMGRPLGFLAPTLDDVEQFLQKRCAQVKYRPSDGAALIRLPASTQPVLLPVDSQNRSSLY